MGLAAGHGACPTSCSWAWTRTYCLSAQIDPKLVITFFVKFEEYECTLSASDSRTEEEDRVLSSLRVFLDYIRKNYRQTLARISSLVSHGEITFELLYAILVPGTVVLRRCPVTLETRAMRLASATKGTSQCGPYYALLLAGLEASAGENDASADAEVGWDEERASGTGVRFGFAETNVTLRYFAGVHKVHKLACFPIEFHPQRESVREMLVTRGRRWAAHAGVSHVHYKGTAIRREWGNDGELKIRRYTVKSRVMIDKSTCSVLFWGGLGS